MEKFKNVSHFPILNYIRGGGLQRTNAEEINMKLISHTLNEAEISISGKVVKHAVGISHSKTDPAKIVIVLIPILKNSEN
ncbi:MAG: hypothetical protein QXY05_00970 [Candidatus Anstonellales archaeon]